MSVGSSAPMLAPCYLRGLIVIDEVQRGRAGIRRPSTTLGFFRQYNHRAGQAIQI